MAERRNEDRRAQARDTPGYELPLLLIAGFRSLVDQLHDELARQGHPDVRPVHGFAMMPSEGATAADIGRRLGVSKQAAGKTVDRLESLGTDRLHALESDLRTITPPDSFGLDAAGWLGGP